MSEATRAGLVKALRAVIDTIHFGKLDAVDLSRQIVAKDAITAALNESFEEAAA